MVGSLFDVWDRLGLGTGTATHQLHLIPHTISPPSITKQLSAVEVAKTKSSPSASDDWKWVPLGAVAILLEAQSFYAARAEDTRAHKAFFWVKH